MSQIDANKWSESSGYKKNKWHHKTKQRIKTN